MAAKGKKALAEIMRKKGSRARFDRVICRPRIATRLSRNTPLNFAPVEPLSTSMLTSTTSSSSMTWQGAARSVSSRSTRFFWHAQRTRRAARKRSGRPHVCVRCPSKTKG